MTTLGSIVGNRGFFPAHLCESGRRDDPQGAGRRGHRAPWPVARGHAAMAPWRRYEDSKKCAELFKAHREEIDGILVTLPELWRGARHRRRHSPGRARMCRCWCTPFPMSRARWTSPTRRDSFCGKMSACNNLTPVRHQVQPDHAAHRRSRVARAFAQDLQRFAAVCRVVKGLRRARFGQVGARPAAFITVRYSEKLLEKAGISVESVDLSEIFGQAWQAGRRRRRGEGQGRRDQGLPGHRRASRPRRCSRWPSSAS